MTPAELLRWKELLAYIDEQLGNNERMALLTHLLATIDPKALIPAQGWMLTEQGHSQDILTVNLSGQVPTKHWPGTISFCEDKWPRSKLGNSLFIDTWREESRDLLAPEKEDVET